MKKKTILIMGLPGSGKTFLARKLSKKLNAYWLNADKIRGKYKDWDFTQEGIIRQVKRMKNLADISKSKYVVADFVCPLKKQIDIFKPNFVIWMDTIKKGRFPKMNKIFIPPKNVDLRLKEKNWKINILLILDVINKYKWNNKNHTAQMLGRFQPWHLGHRKLFEKTLLRNNQVNIQVKDMKQNKNNPYNFSYIKKSILEDLKIYKQRFKITKVPNIMEICYGRTVGYKFKKIKLTKQLHKISATKLRKKMKSLKNQHEV